MHLLAAQAGAIQQEGEAIDLGQDPAGIVFASSADSELALLAASLDRSGRTDLRLASLMRLTHNLSVDLWLENTVRHARAVAIRLIGGAAYWPYGADEIEALARRHGIRLALLPGDAVPDPDLFERSTVSEAEWRHLHALLVAGGPGNADAFLDALRALADGAPIPEASPAPFPRFGLWWPDRGMVAPDALAAILPAGRAFAPILFYRAALEGAGTQTVRALIAALEEQGLAPVPMVVSSLKDAACARFVRETFERFAPDVILNTTGFALGLDGLEPEANPFAGTDAPVIQLVQGGRPEALWRDDPQGLTAKDLAMQVVLPELDGRIGGLIVGHKGESRWHEASQCPLSVYTPDQDGIAAAARLAANWVRLRQTPWRQKRLAIVLANYPLRDGRLANGVGYDAPQSTIKILTEFYKTSHRGLHAGSQRFTDPKALLDALLEGPTNADPGRGKSAVVLAGAEYDRLFATLPETVRTAILERWGPPESDPFRRADGFHLPAVADGNALVMLQPARGYDQAMEASYHDPDLVPPHAYVAAYLYVREVFGAHVLIHNGKHGNLEWLPGKAVALDGAAYSHALWGQLPHLYPFIVNDPGEGTQAKRRTGAVILDHLTPPLTRAETYGPLKDLEALLDEYYTASGMDRRRLDDLRRRILAFTRDARLDRDIGLPEDEMEALKSIDNFLCELKEAQIRDGLHVYGTSPAGTMERDLVVALARVPRGSEPGDLSLIRALADDMALGFDPLTASLGEPWQGPRPPALAAVSDAVWRSTGDTVERLELLAARLVSGEAPDPQWRATGPVLATVETVIRPRLAASGPAETAALIAGLEGRFVMPGPSGAPSRGRIDVLPTGRNFFSLDNRAVPTPTAWELGRQSAEALVRRHLQDHGTYLRAAALSVWGTANMRTGGDDIAQALALIGVKPVWDPSSLRVSGYEIVPLARLGRPRVDVTLRISGFFRDAFPAQIALFDRAVRAIGALDEPEDMNPVSARMRTDALGMMAEGRSEAEAALSAGHRVFGSRPGAYGMGLHGLIEGGAWRSKADLAEAVLDWGQYAYGAHAGGLPERARFAARLGEIEAVIHNQDNREHDLLDSDDYYQYEGGLALTAETLSGRTPINYHNDHSRPMNPVIRTLEEEVSRTMRARVVNPKWIAAMQRHGYKGAFEIVATLDYMFAFAATTGAVRTHHFDLAFEAFVLDPGTAGFIRSANPHGWRELLERFAEAERRGLWTPRSNSAHAYLSGDVP